MATFSLNVPLTSATSALWALKSQSLVGTTVATNWTVVRSGTGSGGVYAQSGDVVSSASALANPGAWWVMQGHAILDGTASYRQQLCWQTDGSGGVRVKVSPRAGFSGGSAGPGRVPSAADERVWVGGGTDASPTYEALFPTSAAWLQARFSEADDSMWAMAYPVGGGPCSALLVVGCLPVRRDTTLALVDPTPHCYYARSGGDAALAASLASERYGPLATLGFGTAAEAWVRCPAALRCSLDSAGVLQVTLPGHLPQSPSLPAYPLYATDTLRLGRRAALAGTSTGANEAGNLNTCGDKGEESYLRWSGRTHSVPTLLDAVDPLTGLSTPGTLLGIGDVVLPWEAVSAVRDGA